LRATASDRVVRNAGWMYANIGLSAALGMVGWIIAARLYSPREVGAVAASVAAAGFIVTVAALGLSETTIRHLHGVENQRRFVTRNLLLVSMSGLAGGVVWWVLTHHLLQSQGIGALGALGILCASAVATTSQTVTDAAIIATRRPALLLIENSLGGLMRLSAIAFVSLGALGLLLSWSVAAVTAMLVSVFVVYRLLGLRSTGAAEVSRLHAFAASNWVSAMASLLTPGITPLLVARSQGARAASWVAIPLLALPLLVAVPSLLARSMFAEASKDPEHLAPLFWRVLPRSLALTAVASGAVAIAAPFVLGLFGPAYATHSTALLRLLALAAFIAVPNYLFDVALNVRRDVVGYAVANVLGNAACLAAVVVVIPGSPTAIGWAWVVGNLAYGCISFIMLARHRRKHAASRL
jgi:O-antigen/teichoic acid export membrane protein